MDAWISRFLRIRIQEAKFLRIQSPDTNKQKKQTEITALYI